MKDQLPTVSTDGKKLAYISQGAIRIQDLSSTQSRKLADLDKKTYFFDEILDFRAHRHDI